MNNWSSIGVVMITHNAASTLAGALRSVPDKAEIVVADANSSDNTVSIAHSFGATVIQQDLSKIAAAGGNFDVARNQAMALTNRQWLFILDSDEQLTKGLAQEISEVIKKNETYTAYDMQRLNYFWGKHVRLLGEDRQIRLLRKGSGNYNGCKLHYPIQIKGSIGQLHESLIHHNINSFADLNTMFQRLPVERKSRTPAPSALKALSYIFHMLRFYLFRQQAWRDGFRGIFISCIYSIYQGLALWPDKK